MTGADWALLGPVVGTLDVMVAGFLALVAVDRADANTVRVGIGRLDTRIDAGFGRLDERIGPLGARLDGQGARIDQLPERNGSSTHTVDVLEDVGPLG